MRVFKVTKVLFATVLMITMAGCSKKSSDESIDSAKEFIKAGQLQSAIVELKSAVQEADAVLASRLLLGQLYYQTGQLLAAEKELIRAQELGSKAIDILPLLSQVYYYSEQYDLAENLSVESLSDSQAISTVSLMRYFASLRNRAENRTLELEDVLSALSEEDKLLAKSYQAFVKNDPKQSSDLLEELKKKNYRPVDTAYLQALLSNQRGDYVEAAKSFATVNQLIPFNNSVDFQEIEALIKAKLYEEAKLKTDKLLLINPDQPLLNLYKSNVHYARSEFEEALFSAEIAIQNGVDTQIARLISGVSAYKVNLFEKAYINLRNLSNRNGFHNDEVQRLLAHVQLSLGYNEDAAQSLRSLIIQGEQDADIFAETGMQLAENGDLAGANEMLGKANLLDGSNISNKLREAMINIGSDENAVIDGLEAVLKQDPELTQGWMQLAMAHLRNGDEKAAIEVANEWAKTAPVRGKTLEGVVYYANNNTKKATKALKEALVIDPQYMGAHQYLLQTYEKAKQYDALFSQAKEVLSFAPDNTQALVAIAKSGQMLQKLEEAENVLTQLINKNSSNLSAYIALAVSAKLQGDNQRAVDFLAPKQLELSALGLMLLGDTYLQLQQADLALSTYRLWQKKEPTSLVPTLRIIGLNELNGDNHEALIQTEKALERFPNETKLAMLKVNYLTKLGNFKAADELIKQLKLAGTDQSSGLFELYEGQLALGLKDFKRAERLLTIYYNNAPSFTSATLLAQAMQGNNNVSGARQLLEDELNKLDNPPARLRHALAEFYQFNSLYEDAVLQYDILIAEKGETSGILNNLANVLQQDKQLGRALLLAKKALEMAPNSAQVLDTLGWIEYESGDLPEAYKHLSDALRIQPNANVIILHLAEVQIALGLNKNAKELLDTLTQASPSQQKQLKHLLKNL